MKVLFNLPVVIAVATLSLTVGCTKKRDAKLSDGDGRYSQSVNEYDGKTFKLQTHGPIGKGGIISSSEEAKSTSDKQSLLKTFPAVDYTTDAKLVDSIAFLAKPDEPNAYEIHYKLTNSHLLVSKVALPAFIPDQEQTYAETLSDGRLSVPLFGYPIVGKVSREVSKNDLGEKTSRLVERSVLDINEASHVQIDFTRFEEFGALKKVDTFPVAFFTGDKNEFEWYFSETILGSPDRIANMIGDSSTFTLFDVKQSLVRFERNQNGLEVVGLAVDEKATQNKSNYKRVAFIPGEYKEFKVDKEGRFRKMREEEESSDKVLWKDTKHVKLDFSRLVSVYANRQSSEGTNLVDISGLKVVSIKLENDYISVIVENASSNVRVHLSFLKKLKTANQYKPLIYHNVDNKLFGYYATMAPSFEAQDYRSRRQSDIEKQFYVNRFNPAKKVIEYHLSKSTADWTIPAAEKSIQTWNDAFRIANTGIEIRLNKSMKVDTGDIRYNVLNLIDAKGVGSGGGLFGYGPVLSDPFTGEVISATSTIHVHNMRTALVYDIRGYVLAKAGILPDYYGKGGNSFQEILTSTAQKMKSFFANEQAAPATETGYSQAQSKSPYKKDAKAFFKEYGDLSKFSNLEFRNKYAQKLGRETAVPVLMENMESDLTTSCKEVMNYIRSIKGSKSKDLNEIPVIEACADKLLVKVMIPTIVHELGHNFGLRHNYGGSADYANFDADAKGNPTVNTSSIMDYVPLDYEKLMKPGKYDVAAIRYAYAGQVQLNQKNGNKFIALNPDKDIVRNLVEDKNLQKSDLRPYKYCTDYEAKAGNTDPMCALHDVGYTPAQVIDFRMKEAHQTFALGQYRYDRAEIRSFGTQYYSFWNSVDPMMKFYGHWREKLAEFMGKKNVHLENQTDESYAKLLSEMQKDPQYSKVYNEYKPLVDRIKNFLMNYAFLTDRYCLVEKADSKNLDLIEFNKVRRQTFAQTQVSVKSCLEDAAQKTLATKKMTALSEFGYSSQNIRYDLSDEGQVSATSNWGSTTDDVLSTAAVKAVAVQALTQRVTSTQKGIEMGLIPSMLDEPTIRKEWLDTLFDRVINGLNNERIARLPELKTILAKGDLKERFLKSKLTPRFSDEKENLDFFLMNTKAGLNVPFSIASSIARARPVSGSIVDSGGQSLGDGISFAAGEEAIYTQAVLKKFMANKAFLEMPEEQLQGIIGLVGRIGLPQTSDELQKMKIQEFMGRIQQLEKTIKEAVGGDADITQAVMDIVNTLFPEVGDARADIEAFLAGEQEKIAASAEIQSIKTKEEKDAKVEEYARKVMAGDAIKIASKFKPFKMEDKVAEIKKMMASMKESSDELSAQKDLMLMFLLVY